MTSAPQSSPGPCGLPASLLLLALAIAAPLYAQNRDVRPASVHKAPNGALLANIVATARVPVVQVDKGWTEIRLDGWVATSLLRRESREGFSLIVTAAEVRLRETPGGREIARLEKGMLLDRRGSQGTWTQVRRRVWVRSRAVQAASRVASRDTTPAERPQAYQAAPALPRAAATASVVGQASATDRIEMSRATQLRVEPEGQATGTVRKGAPGVIVGRSGEWVRVRVEGWVLEDDVKSTSGALLGITTAEVRANPDRYVGQTVEWRLQVISSAVADELRPEMPPGQPYLLTRGPLPESGFVYLMMSREDAARLAALPALSELTVRATIRAARSRFLITPVLVLERVVAPVVVQR